MTPYEMEEHLRNLDMRTTAIEQILPTLATKDDLHLTIAALQHEMEAGFEAAKIYADRLNERTRQHADSLNGATRQHADSLNETTQGQLRMLRGELRGGIVTLSKQIAALASSGRQKRR
jgi:cell division septum initiation protein DivIVA